MGSYGIREGAESFTVLQPDRGAKRGIIIYWLLLNLETFSAMFTPTLKHFINFAL